MVIQHNLMSEFAQIRYKNSCVYRKKTEEKLLSGYKINRAADDAASLSISEKLRAGIRGIRQAEDNIQDGISLLQVADGALNEVDAVLKRIKELSVKAASDTSSDEDRMAIGQEIESMTELIDDIGRNTEFNKIKIFDGTDVSGSGNVSGGGNTGQGSSGISFDDIRLYEKMFTANANSFTNILRAEIPGAGPGKYWNLLYNNGQTTVRSLRVTYDDNGVKKTQYVNLGDSGKANATNYKIGTNSASRDFEIDFGNDVKFKVVEKITVESKQSDSQYYNIEYEVINTGTKDVQTDFMFSGDSAYNSNDEIEQYYMNGVKLDKFHIYTNNSDYINSATGTDASGVQHSYASDISNVTGAGISIVDTDKALPFSASVKFTTRPDTLFVSRYIPNADLWQKYDDIYDFISNDSDGDTTDKADLIYECIWNDTMSVGTSKTYSLKHGIVETKKDPNLAGVDITYDPSVNNGAAATGQTKNIWIQTGRTSGDGVLVKIDRMNSTELGLDNINVGTRTGASDALNLVDEAQKKLSNMRSGLGAYQNRLNSAYSVDTITRENITSAESSVRDTDMAEQMVAYRKSQILMQAGTVMMAQAEKLPDNIDTLLS